MGVMSRRGRHGGLKRATLAHPALWSLALTLLAAAAAAGEVWAKILVDRDGVVRVTDAALRQAGFVVAPAAAARLRLRNRGQEVPLLVRTPHHPRHGRFELAFIGRFLRGTHTWEAEFGRTNAYLLDLAPLGIEPLRFKRAKLLPPPARLPRLRTSPTTLHAEVDRRLIRFSDPEPPPEAWYWEEVKATDPVPTRVSIKAERIAGGEDFTLRVRLKGYSTLPSQPDHTVDLTWNGTPVGQAVWDGEAFHTFEARLGGDGLKEGNNELGLRATGENSLGIDLVLLDWVEISYRRRNLLPEDGQAAVVGAGSAATVVEGTGVRPLLVFDSKSPRIFEIQPRADSAVFRGEGLPEEERLLAVRGGRGYQPKAIVVSHPTDLEAENRGADFIILTHPSLRPAADRLAAVRRAEGLGTEVVEVDDVYDRFGHGLRDPEALRAFLQHAYRHWSPRPRYLLLLGDASWDFKNRLVADEYYADWHWGAEGVLAQVPKNDSTPYAPGLVPNVRGLIPTFQWQSPWGHAASDNRFALLEGDDDLPDLAVGRFPVVTLEEANAVVDKTLEYGRGLPAGPPEVLLVTDDQQHHQLQSDELAREAAATGYAQAKIYPRPDEKDNQQNTRRIIDAFDRGETIVVFAGHGGRYIWRTGPPDLKKNHDLFTIEHLDRLKPGVQLPVVVSLTCYSAPFDHPTADSIGEKLLRVPGRGAIAVIASSWRNVPPFSLARGLIAHLGDPQGPRIGDAFLKAMRSPEDPVALNTYNLLGDPSARFVRPNPAGGRDASIANEAP